MHEISLMERLFDILEKIISDNNLRIINTVTVSIGGMKQVIPETFRFAFDVLKKNTAAENAELIIVFIPVKIRCEKCGSESVITDNIYICGNCSSPDTRVFEGDELIIKSIDAEK